MSESAGGGPSVGWRPWPVVGWVLMVGLQCLGMSQWAVAQIASYERPPIDYLNAEVHDPVARLDRRLESGEVTLDYDPKYGYLPAVLKALKVPVSSQTLVFSKTSLQVHKISPRLPRAIYFNDDLYVGYCQRGDVLELAATDAKQGATFYTLEQSTASPPRFTRDRGSCLTCHASARTQNVPGYLIRSVYPSSAGHALLGSGTFTTDERSPFRERWGGWYVTGEHGSMLHMGNQIYTKESAAAPELGAGANIISLGDRFRSEAYMSEHGDLVALMVLEHQTQMHNALAAANYETRLALHQSYEMNAILERPVDWISETAQRRIDAVVEEAVQRLLFCREFPLQDPVSGTSDFAAEFAGLGPRDSQGRGLRTFDLRSRLFRYPCSYLIYSESFRRLPPVAHGAIIQRIRTVLTADEAEPGYEHLSTEDRQAIWEILTETHPDFLVFVNDSQ
jgi:hypothetical protein